MTEADYRIEALTPSFDAYGLVLDLLSRHAPFADSPLKHMSQAVRLQLRKGRQLAALTGGDELLAYAGWVPTRSMSAALWVEGRGQLEIVESDHDAVAVTIVVSTDANITRALLRRVRQQTPNLRWYFKRHYGGQLRAPRKQTLLNRG